MFRILKITQLWLANMLRFPRCFNRIVQWVDLVKRSSRLVALSNIEVQCGPFLGMGLDKALYRCLSSGSKRLDDASQEYYRNRLPYPGRGTHKVLALAEEDQRGGRELLANGTEFLGPGTPTAGRGNIYAIGKEVVAQREEDDDGDAGDEHFQSRLLRRVFGV